LKQQIRLNQLIIKPDRYGFHKMFFGQVGFENIKPKKMTTFDASPHVVAAILGSTD
jgi:hypothetical protein